jgi:hypothetical protein
MKKRKVIPDIGFDGWDAVSFWNPSFRRGYVPRWVKAKAQEFLRSQNEGERLIKGGDWDTDPPDLEMSWWKVSDIFRGVIDHVGSMDGGTAFVSMPYSSDYGEAERFASLLGIALSCPPGLIAPYDDHASLFIFRTREDHRRLMNPM